MPRGGEREGAGNKAASQSAEKVYLCSVCGTGHEFKTRKLLNQHEKTTSHKLKLIQSLQQSKKLKKRRTKPLEKQKRLID
jgi:hypothetical protein